MNKNPSRFRTWLRYGLTSSIATLVGALLVANFGDQQADIDYKISEVASVESHEFQLVMENMMGPTFTHGNRVDAYQNGDEIFPPMLEAIRGAKQTINFESYIYVSGKIGDEFVDALAERARAGVKVNLLLDWVGSNSIAEAALERLAKAGVDIKKYHPFSWFTITKMNNRTHRKLLIVDGRIGFTGGVGISDDWAGKGDSPEHWRDSHYRVVGPVVGQMQAAFTDNWVATSPDVLQGELYFPFIPKDGPSTAQMFKSSPREGAASALLFYLMSIRAARKDIRISNAYFVPGKLAIRALIEARKRGVRVQVIVPGPIIDTQSTRMASRETWGPLLEAGVEILEFQPTMYHCKVMIIDGDWISVGSTNFDDRSFRLNDEANLNILDRDFAQKQIQVFDDDRSKSKLVTLDEWNHRSWKERIAGFFLFFVSSQL